MDETLNSVNAEVAEVVTPQTAETEVKTEQVETVKTEKAEVVEQPQKKHEQSQEDNARYAAIRRRAEAEARDKTAAEMAKIGGWVNLDGTPITTLEQYRKAVMHSTLQQRGIDPQEYEALRENDPDVQEARRLKAEIQKREQESAQMSEFFKEFETANGRAFDIKTDAEIFVKVKTEAENSGKSMSDVYAKVRMKDLEAKLKDYEAQLKAVETNKANAESSPGSVGASGTNTSGEITWEIFEANRRNQTWLKKNFDKVMDLYKKG